MELHLVMQYLETDMYMYMGLELLHICKGVVFDYIETEYEKPQAVILRYTNK